MQTPDTTIRFEALRPGEQDWKRAQGLYENSFPGKERRSPEAHLAALADPLFHATAIRSGDRFAGLLYYWDAPRFTYIEHLAVDTSMRGTGIGSKALEAFCRRCGRVILEIDPPVDEISIRRLHFYERLGFVGNTCTYIHPSFSRPFRPHRLVLMSYPSSISEDECRTLERFVCDRVLRYSDHAPAK